MVLAFVKWGLPNNNLNCQKMEPASTIHHLCVSVPCVSLLACASKIVNVSMFHSPYITHLKPIYNHTETITYAYKNHNHIPYAPCMEYLPTFALKITQLCRYLYHTWSRYGVEMVASHNSPGIVLSGAASASASALSHETTRTCPAAPGLRWRGPGRLSYYIWYINVYWCILLMDIHGIYACVILMYIIIDMYMYKYIYIYMSVCVWKDVTLYMYICVYMWYDILPNYLNPSM